MFAAVSLSAAFEEMADTFRVHHPGTQVQFNFAGTPTLMLQLVQGAQADVFASADQPWMAAARDSGYVAGNPLIFAHNALVVIVPAANPGHIERIEDLVRPGLKLVLAGETVPAGRYARQVFERLANTNGMPREFDKRVLRNVASNEENVKGVLTKVALGEADVGVVYESDITAADGERVKRIPIPEDAGIVAVYPIAALTRAKDPALARAFVDLVMTGNGQRVLIRHGFRSPPI